MNFKQELEKVLLDALKKATQDAQIDLNVETIKINLDRPKQADHGDFSTNLAMQCAKAFKKSPKEIAQLLINQLQSVDFIEKVELAGVGFINFFINQSVQNNIVLDVLNQGEKYGFAPAGSKKSVQVEFVSANPTGPLHVGHGRGAAYGASLCNLLETAGYNVHREYYVNDAGRQMDILATSMWLRLLEINGVSIDFPKNAYQGDYVKEMANQFNQNIDKNLYIFDQALILDGLIPVEQDLELHLDSLIAKAKTLLGDYYAIVHACVLKDQLDDCANDLKEFSVEFDTWYSEKSLYDSGKVADAVGILESKGHLYEKDGALWFKSTDFGDEKDRVVRRENGIYTYFASDIAYHFDKFQRGFDIMINIWGADHHGYIARLKGALTALGLDASRLLINLVQFAILYRNGEKASMSTRSGEFVTLRQLRAEVGNDACRFFYVQRKCDQHLDFDLDLAKSKSNENPIYYIQYGYARIASVLRQIDTSLNLTQANVSLLTDPNEEALITQIQTYPEVISRSADEFAPHVIAYFLKDVSANFHRYYNAVPFLKEENADIRLARLALLKAVGQVLNNGLSLLGVSCPEQM